MLEMHCLVFVIASLFLYEVIAQAPPIERIVTDYFNSRSVRNFKSSWQSQRKPMEHAIKTALAETVGLPGMNVYIRKVQEKFAGGYVHNDNQVQLILSDLYLKGMPRCRLPELQFSLASDVLKIQTALSEMIIHANYSLVRNQKDIIYETEDQDPFKFSPFLFIQVEDVGKVAIRVDGCTLSGFIITTLSGDSVNLGYDYFKLSDCVYTIEIYNPYQNAVPVIAKYNLDTEDDAALTLTDLLLKPLLTEELMPKMQAAIFSIINASAIFGSSVNEYRENQQIVFQNTAQYMTELIRNLNRLTVEKNEGIIDMEDYTLQWDEENLDEIVKLTGMVLFGLDTMYSAHSGGPLKMDRVMIAEEIRFSTLQVRGTFQAPSKGTVLSFDFAVEITDLVVDVHLEEQLWHSETGFKLIEVKGLRRMTFSLPAHKTLHIAHDSEQSLISGYLLSEVPKLIHAHLTEIFYDAVHPNNV